ncbi:MAG: oxaloacetate decarboxylase [Lachnospiraceae bacterium]|nr:oxaloacetate decarboxylase [Lachnospiraceae bacterium]
MKKVMSIILGIIGIVATLIGLVSKIKGNMSVSYLGGSDGPTSVFIAGRVGSDFSSAVLVIGIICLIVTVFLFFRNRK